MRKSLPAAVTTALGIAVLAPLSAAAMDAPSGAELSVLHAVPATPVDVYVNGALTLDDFEPGDLAGPLELAAPAVDVWAGEDVVVPGLENPDEASLEVPAGTVSAAVSVAGTTDPVIGPADVEVKDGVTTIAYAWGSAADGTLALATQEVAADHSAPGSVPAGIDVAPAQDSTGMLAAVGAGAAALVAGAVLMARRRAARA